MIFVESPSSLRPIAQKRNLEPMALKDAGEVEGFWVDKLSKTAYHISKVGPVGSVDSKSAGQAERVSPERSRTGDGRSQNDILEADPRMGGELPPMDPRRALEPERMEHLEKVASFLYDKVGPLPELMVRFKLRVFDEMTWKAWKQEQRDRTWAEAKKFIRQSAKTNSSQTTNEEENVQDVKQAEVIQEESQSISDSSPWNHTRMLLLKLSITFQELKETIAAEFGLEARSVELMAKVDLLPCKLFIALPFCSTLPITPPDNFLVFGLFSILNRTRRMRTTTSSQANKDCDLLWQLALECKRPANSIAREQVLPFPLSHPPAPKLRDAVTNFVSLCSNRRDADGGRCGESYQT